MKELNSRQVKELLISAANGIISSKQYLTDIDGRIGDGDHGIGMEMGMAKAAEALNTLPEGTAVNDMFKAVGRAMIMSMGGASGVIFGTMFQGGGKLLPNTQSLSAAEVKRFFRGGLEAVKQRGKAQVGDKTMVDALEPAVIAMENCGSEDILQLLQAAESAAYDGMLATKDMIAKFGRAKSLMERSLGFQDAGASSVWIILRSMREYVETLREGCI